MDCPGRCSISSPTTLEIYREGVQQELKSFFAGREGFLYNLLQYQLGWVDQQGNPEYAAPRESFHSLFAPAVCEALTGDFRPAMPAAAAIELIYNFSLVHGDVQAGRFDAQTRPSVWWLWGPAQAINAGDGFHALGRVALMRLMEFGISAEKTLIATELLDRSCLAMCEGQFSDLGFQDRLLVTSGEYDAMISLKTGALTGCSAAGGAIAAGADDAQIERFRELGSKLGMAWQISRDIVEFWGREGDGITASNFLNKKKSLPLILALEQCSTAAKWEIGSIYSKRVLESDDLVRVIALMNETDAQARSEARAASLVDEALSALESESIAGERSAGLRALAKLAISR